MGVMDLFRRRESEGSGQTVDAAELVSRYKRMRAASLKLNEKLVERLSKDAMEEGGRKLGLLKRGVFVFDSEDESTVLMDYCIYDVRRKGRNAIEEYLRSSRPDPNADEMACLRAMQHAVYSLFVIESVSRGLGVTVRDLLSGETYLVVDMGFSKTGRRGIIFIGRLLLHEGFAMSSGALLPIGVASEEQRREMAEHVSRTIVVDKNERFDPAPLISECLRGGATSHVRYEDPDRGPAGHHLALERRQAVDARRQAIEVRKDLPCPCGSGRKYKNCCRKRH